MDDKLTNCTVGGIRGYTLFAALLADPLPIDMFSNDHILVYNSNGTMKALIHDEKNDILADS